MSLQQQIDKVSIAMLPKIETAIKNADAYEANQMRYFALQDMNNSIVAIDKMNKSQLARFENNLLKMFEYNNWLGEMTRQDFIEKMTSAIRLASSSDYYCIEQAIFVAFGCGDVGRNSSKMHDMLYTTKLAPELSKIKSLQFLLKKCLDNKFYTTLV